MQETKYRLEMNKITKRFGGVAALTDVSLKVRPQEIHALIGENGAGKSTLMKVLSGAYKKDSGEILIDGQPVVINNPKDAKNLGIAIIYQEFMLAPDLTVAENIFIDQLAAGKMLINWHQLRKKAKEQLVRLGFEDISPTMRVGSLSVAYQQVVEICKNLIRNAKVLVLDEPTAVLTFSEIKKLFGILRKLRDEGVSIVYISHRLEELFELSDHITVLKDGGYVGTVATGSIDKEQLATMMVGRELSQMFPKRTPHIGDEILKVEHLSVGRVVKDVSFTLRAGEIVGFSGLVGAGRTEAMRAIFGADHKTAGKIIYFGKEVNFQSPQEAIRSGFGLLPENRKEEGLLLKQSIRVNSTLTVLNTRMTRFGVISHRKEKKFVQQLLQQIATKYDDLEDSVDSLSGGNQQKVAVAKWIAAKCKCVVFDEPTRGVDVGAKVEIYKLMNELVAGGVGIIMISSEIPEIIGMCDRVIVMRQGMVTGEFDGADMNENNMIKSAMGVRQDES